MKLILLPGMDGTGRLFEPLVDELEDSLDISVIPLPTGQDQSYDLLTRYVRERLPQDEKFVLLAESFSGPIAYRLLQDEENNIVTIIFVATFIKRPVSFAGLLSRFVSDFFLKRSFVSDFAVKVLIAGFDVSEELLREFWRAAHQAGSKVYRSRLKAIGSLPEPTNEISKKCYYIQAENDRLVPGRNYREFQRLFEDVKLYRVSGPHGILQVRPEECADVVNEILAVLESGNP